MFDRGWCGKTGHDDGRIACHLSHVAGDRYPCLRQLGISFGIEIEADHMPSALDQVARNRASHNAKTDNPNGLVHSRSLPPVDFRLTGKASQALIADHAINNRQGRRSGQAEVCQMAGVGRKPSTGQPAGPDTDERALATMETRAKALVPQLRDRAARTEEL